MPSSHPPPDWLFYSFFMGCRQRLLLPSLDLSAGYSIT
jgi:hypothetical protein